MNHEREKRLKWTRKRWGNQRSQRKEVHRERETSKDHKTKHVKRSERATLEMKTERAFKRQQRHPEGAVGSGLIRYDTRHGSLPWPALHPCWARGQQCSEQEETWRCPHCPAETKNSSVSCVTAEVGHLLNSTGISGDMRRPKNCPKERGGRGEGKCQI